MMNGSVEFIFGGTFDPVHLGHLAIVRQLAKIGPNTPIRILPCATPALKSLPGATFAQRVAMLELALPPQVHCLIDLREAERRGPSYTVDTLRQLVAESPQIRRILVIGGDSALDLNRWHHSKQLAGLCHLLVLNRPGVEDAAVRAQLSATGFRLAAQFAELTLASTGIALMQQMPPQPQSSTNIREYAAKGQSLDTLLPPSVIEYVRENRLYTSEES